jgi:hypothetical protein
MKLITILFLSMIVFTACGDNDRNANSDGQNDIDAARDFIRASLDGNFKKARLYMLPDSLNEERMHAIERVNLSQEEKKGLAAASINIHQVLPINDTATVVIYSNSFKNNRDTLRVIKESGKWLVDFNYLFDHDNDTTVHYPNTTVKPAE